MKYTAPIIEIEVLELADVVMVSGVSISNTEGKLTEITFGDLT